MPTEFSATTVADAMTTDHQFLREMLTEVAARIDDGSLTAAACAALAPSDYRDVEYVAWHLETLSSEIRFEHPSRQNTNNE